MSNDLNFKGKRFLTDRPRDYESWIEEAKEYVGRFDEEQNTYMYLRPFGGDNYKASYFSLMYNLLNLLEKMNIKQNSRILEVGSGPGWVTEILMGLGYIVDCLEPSADFIKVAKNRIESYAKHLKFRESSNVNFYCETLEQCSLPDSTYDAILFFDSLHHVVDERAGLEQCFRLLRHGGCLAISEGAWSNGNEELEEYLNDEIRRFGTFESPFTIEYLDYLLNDQGFVQMERYYQVNGLFPVYCANQTLSQVASLSAESSNTVITYKPYKNGSTADNPFEHTLAEINLVAKETNHLKGTARLSVTICNKGNTVWINKISQKGYVTLAFYQGDLKKGDFIEMPRVPLPKPICPGEEVVLNVNYKIPECNSKVPWHFDLINEGYYWFSTRGTLPLETFLD